MARKVYTVELDDEKLVNSVGSKASKVKAHEAQKEVENYGIVEINNKSTKGKVKNTKDAGFQKNVVGTEKKAVKSSVSKVDDYFDFSFRPVAQVETKKVSTKKSVSKSAETKVLKTEIIEEAKSCQTFTLNEEARKVVSVAREGSLFG